MLKFTVEVVDEKGSALISGGGNHTDPQTIAAVLRIYADRLDAAAGHVERTQR